MPYIVIAECVDIRSGRRFQPGEMFEPDPDAAQAERLTRAGAIKEATSSAGPAEPPSAPRAKEADGDGGSTRQDRRPPVATQPKR